MMLLKPFAGNPEANKVYQVDALELLRALPDASVDLVVTSPPYNLLNSTGGGFKNNTGGNWKNAALRNGYESHTDDMPYPEYVAWQRKILSESLRVIKPTGAIFYNHKPRVQGGLWQDRNDLVGGFPVRQVVIWSRGLGNNFNDGYFLPSYEVIYLITKSGFKLAPKANALTDVWSILPERNNPHPAPFPIEIPKRCIQSSLHNSLVVDPFGGSGTTAIAAKACNVDYILAEKSLEYAEQARKRIAGQAWRKESKQLEMFAA